MSEFGGIDIIANGELFQDFSSAADAIADQLDADFMNAVVPITQAMYDFLQRVADTMQRRHSTPWAWSGPTSSSPDLQVRSGTGLKSILDSRQVDSDDDGNVKGSISTAQMWAIHEEGGTISARGKYLTIPLEAALDSRGLPLRPSARDWPNTFVQKTHAGNLVIFMRKGKDIIPMYLLKRSVKIPARLGLGDAFNDAIPFFEQRVLDAIAASFDQ